MAYEPPTIMGQVFLKDGRIIPLTEEQTYSLAKLIMFIPYHKKIKLGNETFSLDQLDHEAKRISRLPQQTGIGINVGPVKETRKKVME